MIVAGSGSRVVVATRPVDFRKGHDGLAPASGWSSTSSVWIRIRASSLCSAPSAPIV